MITPPESARPVPSEFAEYVSGVAAMDPARGELLARVIALVEGALPAGYARAIEFRMPSWVIPLADYADTYNKRPLALAALAAQKNYTSLYLTGVYVSEGEDSGARERSFRDAWRATGKKLDMGKSCVRFRRYDDLAHEVIADEIRRTPPAVLITEYERARNRAASG